MRAWEVCLNMAWTDPSNGAEIYGTVLYETLSAKDAATAAAIAASMLRAPGRIYSAEVIFRQSVSTEPEK